MMANNQLPAIKHQHDFERMQRIVDLLELIVGLRPFRVHYPLDAAVPIIKLNKLGVAIAMVHAAIFCGCVVLVLWVAPKSRSIISDGDVAAVQNVLLGNLQMTTAVIMFLMVYRQLEKLLQQAPLERQIMGQMRKIPGYNLARFYRNSGRMLLVSLILVVLTVLTLYATETWFWSYQVEDKKYMIPFFSMANIMPFLYAEMLIMQFSRQVMINKLRMDELNWVLQRLGVEGEERGEMYAEYYVGKR